jgi:tRNA-uridine 2-sulfurtransferase
VSDSKKNRGHAIALFSGGLDSALAILLVMQQGIEVTALTFLTHFESDIKDRSTQGSDPNPISKKFGFKIILGHLGEDFIKIVKSPKFGHGKNMNPCVDCHIMMLKEAKRYMELVGADFVITGEVISQRPKSQFRNMLNAVEKESGLKGYLVRPLCAKLLNETIPEKEGLLDRSKLEDINGRSRKRQMEMAEKFGLEDYPSPASGCLLTDRSYSNRLRDLFEHNDKIDFNDLNLLRVGRHFRLDEHTKVIVGRNEKDNDKIEKYAGENHLILEALDTGSPIVIYSSSKGEERLKDAAAITARYCDDKDKDEVEITILNKDDSRKIRVVPADPDEFTEFIIR